MLRPQGHRHERGLVRVQNTACNYWEEEPDAPSPMPGWMKDIFEQHKVI